jgi:hypothetical protein
MTAHRSKAAKSRWAVVAYTLQNERHRSLTTESSFCVASFLSVSSVYVSPFCGVSSFFHLAYQSSYQIVVKSRFCGILITSLVELEGACPGVLTDKLLSTTGGFGPRSHFDALLEPAGCFFHVAATEGNNAEIEVR